MRLEDLVGRSVGRYQIIALLGRGGMAAVYRAHDTALRRDVALKVLYPQYVGDKALVERFQREAVLAARLDHPGIVPIYDVGEADGVVYIAMRLLAGPPLGDVLRGQARLSLDETLTIVEQVGAALDYAHARGVVHRDIKPANIILEGLREPVDPQQGLGTAFRAVITDFGIAKSLDAPGLTSTGMMIGTPEYMAPEQIRGDPHVDGRTDVYALGVLVYRCLTGRRPFEGTTQEVLIGHLEGTVIEPSQLDASVPPAVGAAVRIALARRPADRYASAGEFARALRSAVRMEAPVGGFAARPPAPPPPSAEPTRRGDARPPASPEVVRRAADPRPPPADYRTTGPRPAPAAPAYDTPPPRRRSPWPLLLVALLVLGAAGGGLLLAQAFPGQGAAVPTLPPAPTDVPPPTLAVPEAPTLTPAPTAEVPPTATPTPEPTAAPTEAPTATVATPTRRPATATPTLAPATATPSPIPATATPTVVPTATPCPIPSVGGFGLLRAQNPALGDRLGCPLGAEQGGVGTLDEQQFQRGAMFYFRPTERIYVLLGRDDGRWRAFDANTLKDRPTPLPETPPSAELIVPKDLFGLVWSLGSGVRDDLGFAVSAQVTQGEGALQTYDRGTMLFSRVGLGRGKSIYVLYDDGTFERYDDPNP